MIAKLQAHNQLLAILGIKVKVSAPVSGHFCALMLYLHHASEFIQL